MLNSAAPLSIERWLADVRGHFSASEPDLLSLFDIYAAEAVFGRRYIAADLEHLSNRARVLEVGAGSMLLSCQLVREGFQVTSLEPTGFGFAHFHRMRHLILEMATAQGCQPRILDLTAEELAEIDCFDYAFSVNVMEHVDDVASVISNVSRSLAVGGAYRFTCPNYLFPYEPHFNIPTLISKRLTETVLRRKIYFHKKMPDPSGLWKSLNWINVLSVKNIAKRLPEMKTTFNRGILVSTIERMQRDRDFANRRSPAMRKALTLLVSYQLHQLFRFVPAMLQPIMDCRVQRISESGSR